MPDDVGNKPRCHGDWQGPSDDSCEDDLLVIPCGRPAASDHGTRCMQPVHLGVYEGQIVQWSDVAGDLFDLDGDVIRRQFVPSLNDDPTTPTERPFVPDSPCS